MAIDDYEVIQHYGTAGMRWGVRKARGDRSAFKKRAKDRTTYEKSPNKLSSAELEKRIKRMETEKKYNELNKRDIGKGEALASEILTNSGRAIATTVVTGAGIFAVKYALKKKFGEEVAGVITKRK
jgi:hypothetical protein